MVRIDLPFSFAIKDVFSITRWPLAVLRGAQLMLMIWLILLVWGGNILKYSWQRSLWNFFIWHFNIFHLIFFFLMLSRTEHSIIGYNLPSSHSPLNFWSFIAANKGRNRGQTWKRRFKLMKDQNDTMSWCGEDTKCHLRLTRGSI